jgi:hypothetical protein
VNEQRWVVEVEETESVHDLSALAEEVRREYFPDVPTLPIRWGQQITRKKRRSIRLGSYDHRTTEVRIHPSLSPRSVPRYFVQSVIHHEYLHHILGRSHDRRFKAFERRYRFHRASQLWLQRNLVMLLGRRERVVQPRPPVVPARVSTEQLALF